MTKKHLDSIVDDFDVTGVALMTLAKVWWSSWDVEDPYEQDLQKYKDTKNEIDLYVSMFLSIILIPWR
jgi:protein-tyrosine-phosphatase